MYVFCVVVEHKNLLSSDKYKTFGRCVKVVGVLFESGYANFCSMVNYYKMHAIHLWRIWMHAPDCFVSLCKGIV